jgi:hypothetical protein
LGVEGRTHIYGCAERAEAIALALRNYFIVDYRHSLRKLTRSLTRLMLADEQFEVSQVNSQGSMSEMPVYVHLAEQ